jgi:hypothetical protein
MRRTLLGRRHVYGFVTIRWLHSVYDGLSERGDSGAAQDFKTKHLTKYDDRHISINMSIIIFLFLVFSRLDLTNCTEFYAL